MNKLDDIYQPQLFDCRKMKEGRKMGTAKQTIFISYSQEDDEHNNWVASFADQLRKKGFSVILDQTDLVLGDRLPQFMEQSIDTANSVLIICTPMYREKANARKGGVGYEGHIISAEIYAKHNERKFIPIVRKGTFETAYPTYLLGKLGLSFVNDSFFDRNLEKLINTLKNIKREYSSTEETALGNPTLSSKTENTGKSSEAFLLQDISDLFLDPIAQKSHEKKFDAELARVILAQSDSGDPSKLPHRNVLVTICDKIYNSHSRYPLVIEGLPGTGKSTLLSLLFLNFRPSAECYKALIDLHHFDSYTPERAKTDLASLLKTAAASIEKAKECYLFIDGLNGYDRLNNGLEEILRAFINNYRSKKIHFILAKGELNNDLFPPFSRRPFPTTSDEVIRLVPISAASSNFGQMVRKVLSCFSIIKSKYPKAQDKAAAYHRRIDNFITYCKKMSGNDVEFRTVAFCAARYLDYGDSLFQQSVGEVLLNYFTDKMFAQKGDLSKYAQDVAEFMINRESTNITWTNSIVFKSPVYRDFLFAYHYLNVIKLQDEKGMQVFNCIFTASINRILVDLIKRDSKTEERVINSLVSLYPKMDPKAQAQAVYLLGRCDSERAKRKSVDFLRSEYFRLVDNLVEVKKHPDRVMLFRSIGISLIYLKFTDHENSFFHLLIYDDVIKKINLNFHIAYYSMSTYKIGDEVQIGSDFLYTPDKLNHLYNFLIQSVMKPKERGKQGVNIITLVSLYILQRYPDPLSSEVGMSTLIKSSISNEKKERFNRLITKLSSDVSITNSEIKSYLLRVREFLCVDNAYADALSKMYTMKEIQRKGWTEKGREIDKAIGNVESDADHTWACCLLATIFLSEKIEDCTFLSENDKKKYAKQYDLNLIIKMLLIHDIPEIYTGDVPLSQQNKKEKKERETAAMQAIATLDSFPRFGSFSSIANWWYEYEKRDNINSVIAYQIDKIEPLIQLFIYRKYLPKATKEKQRDAWIDYAMEQVQSCNPNISFGNNLIRFLSSYLLEEDFLDDLECAELPDTTLEPV